MTDSLSLITRAIEALEPFAKCADACDGESAWFTLADICSPLPPEADVAALRRARDARDDLIAEQGKAKTRKVERTPIRVEDNAGEVPAPSTLAAEQIDQVIMKTCRDHIIKISDDDIGIISRAVALASGRGQPAPVSVDEAVLSMVRSLGPYGSKSYDVACRVIDYIRCLADLTKPAPDDGWRDISTAPRDGTDVVLWHGRSNVGGWHKDWPYDARYPQHDCWVINGGYIVKPTHWRPLPPPPAERKE